MPPMRTTTPMTDDAIKALIAQGVATALAEYEANIGSENDDDSHNSGSGRRRESALLVKGTDVLSYNQCFQELALMCGRIFPEEFDEFEKYVGGLPDMIQGSVMASKPKTMQDAIEIENDLMDQKICTIAERQVENKRKVDNDNQAQQQPLKKQNVARAYSAGSSEKKEYAETLPSPATTNNQRTLTCYECGNQGHYRSDCPELKNQNHGNQAGGAEARRMVYALGRGETDQDIDDMEDDINA
ncbi:reverse transcriptase domain-containing protein [Tanacetum coccineum]